MDKGIALLIEALWAAGINTRASCEAFEDGSGRVWVVFPTAADGKRFRRLGRRQRQWPPVVPCTVTAADLVPDDPEFALGDRFWMVLFPRHELPAVLARLRAVTGPSGRLTPVELSSPAGPA